MARSDWRMQTLWGDTEENYQYALAIELDGVVKEARSFSERELVTVTIVLSDMKPIEYVLN